MACRTASQWFFRRVLQNCTHHQSGSIGAEISLNRCSLITFLCSRGHSRDTFQIPGTHPRLGGQRKRRPSNTPSEPRIAATRRSTRPLIDHRDATYCLRRRQSGFDLTQDHFGASWVVAKCVRCTPFQALTPIAQPIGSAGLRCCCVKITGAFASSCIPLRSSASRLLRDGRPPT